jgi:hypothetical protein
MHESLEKGCTASGLLGSRNVIVRCRATAKYRANRGKHGDECRADGGTKYWAVSGMWGEVGPIEVQTIESMEACMERLGRKRNARRRIGMTKASTAKYQADKGMKYWADREKGSGPIDGNTAKYRAKIGKHSDTSNR